MAARELSTSQGPRAALIGFGASLLVLAALFIRPILDLVAFASANELYSHVLLVPFVSLYLVWDGRRELARCEMNSGRAWALPMACAAIIPLLAWWTANHWAGRQFSIQDSLFLLISSLVVFCVASGFFFFGRQLMTSISLPVSLLFFSVPLPTGVERGVELCLQYVSADAASVLFQLSGTPVVRQGLFFHLPHITLEVARECSGIRSTLVLLITSVVAGYLFLRSPWRRTVLALIVIPLAIGRNGLRIFTIGMLCVHVDPGMVHSWVHLKGGPLFFVISLVPFFALLLFLRRSETAKVQPASERQISPAVRSS